MTSASNSNLANTASPARDQETQRPIGGVFIGLGANLGDRAANIAAAIEAMGRLPTTRVLRVSSLHETKPVGGPPNQPDYLNGVAEIDTALSPRELLSALQQIESVLGRIREIPNGARTIDLDILLFHEAQLSESDLTIPHPRMHQRRFVIEPLEELTSCQMNKTPNPSSNGGKH